MKKSTVLLIAVLMVVFNAAAWKELRADERNDEEFAAAQVAGCYVLTQAIINIEGTDLGFDRYVKISEMSKLFLEAYVGYVIENKPNVNFYMDKAIEKVANNRNGRARQLTYCEEVYDLAN